jgi:hypothetical protein
MNIEFTDEENKLIEHAKEAIVKYNTIRVYVLRGDVGAIIYYAPRPRPTNVSI